MTGRPAQTVWDLVEQRAQSTPDALMSVDEHGQRVTFAEFQVLAERAAAGLAAAGISAGGVVSWMLPTCHQALVIIAALARLDVVQNPVIPIYRHRELTFVTRQLSSSHLLVPPVWRDFDYPALADHVAAERPGLQVTVVDGQLPWGDPALLPPPPTADRSEAANWRFYTSGTTSDPKGARHSDATLIAAAIGVTGRLEVGPDDRNALVFPITHIAGPIWLIASLLTGCANILVEAFEAESTSRVLAREGVTLAGAGMAFQRGYLSVQAADPEAVLFPDLRCCPCGGSPRSPDLHREVKAHLGGAGIFSAWGLTEAPILTMATYGDTDQQLAETEGRPMPGVAVVAVDDVGSELEAGAEGQLVVTGPQVMLGYVDESLNASAFDAIGRLRTGDLGTVDSDGFIRITGRLKDVIIRKGENISAKEVEDLLFENPKVADVAVFGLPDDVSGEIACAVIQSVDEQDPLSFRDMQTFLVGQGLRMQALPERLEIVAIMPRGPEGKILKRKLKEQFEKSDAGSLQQVNS